jgi:hypothetical protein
VIQKRVLLALSSKSAMLREALRHRLEQQPEIQLVGEVFNPVDLLVAVGETEAEIVIENWEASEGMPSIYTHLFDEYPPVKVIRLNSAHANALLYERRIVASPLPGTMENLLSVICHSPEPTAEDL